MGAVSRGAARTWGSADVGSVREIGGRGKNKGQREKRGRREGEEGRGALRRVGGNGDNRIVRAAGVARP